MNSQLAAERGLPKTLALLVIGIMSPVMLFGLVALAIAPIEDFFRGRK